MNKTFVDLYKERGSTVENICDNQLHGWGCQCLKGRGPDGEVIDEELAELEDALEEALEEQEMAMASIEEAENLYESASFEVEQLEKKIAAHRKRRI